MTRDDSLLPFPLDQSFLWLLVATPLLFVATGQWVIPIAAWVAPMFMLRFVRDQPAWRGCTIAALVFAIVCCITWHGALEMPLYGALIYVVGATIGLTAALPYVIDRLLTPRLSGIAATLVFPTAVTAVEYAASFGPFGTWGSAAYTQQSLALLQLTSVTGIWGISFLLHWTASVANAAWEEGFSAPRVQWAGGLWAGLLVGTLLFGGARLAFTELSDPLPVATVTGRHDASTFWSVRRTAPNRDAVRDSARVVQRDYLDRARRAARAGARLVSWPEAAVPVPIEDTTAFLERARTVATEHRVFLAMAVNVFPYPNSKQRLENKVIWMGPKGMVRAEARKTHLVPGEPGKPGTGQLPVVETPYGTWTSVVCYDMDFPALLRQAGQRGIDLIVAPSNDWRAIATMHAHMARVRAIENGTSLVRPTSNGRTLVTDPLGRTRGQMKTFPPETPLLTAHVPTQGLATLYPLLGDAFAWGCGVGILFLIGFGVWGPSPRPPEPISAQSA